MKRLVCAALICALTLALCGCAGIGDFESQPLPGGYVVARSSAHVLTLAKDGVTVIPAEVYAVACNDEYICVQWEDPEPYKDDYSREPHGELSYYIISVYSGCVEGPLDQSEFLDSCAARGITGLGEWTPARKLPRH